MLSIQLFLVWWLLFLVDCGNQHPSLPVKHLFIAFYTFSPGMCCVGHARTQPTLANSLTHSLLHSLPHIFSNTIHQFFDCSSPFIVAICAKPFHECLFAHPNKYTQLPYLYILDIYTYLNILSNNIRGKILIFISTIFLHSDLSSPVANLFLQFKFSCLFLHN